MSHLSKSAWNGQENLRCFLHERRLMLKRKRQVAVALRLGGQRSKSPASHTKGRQLRMRDLFYALQAQCNLPKICWGNHETLIVSSPGLAGPLRRYEAISLANSAGRAFFANWRI